MAKIKPPPGAVKPEYAHVRGLGTDPFPEYERHDAMGLASLVRAGEITPSELMEAAAVRFQARNSALNAIVVHWLDEARKSARQAISEGQFSGVPFVLKNLGSEMKGTPLEMGSRLFAGNRTEEDSEIVKRFRAAGLIPFGRGIPPNSASARPPSRCFTGQPATLGTSGAPPAARLGAPPLPWLPASCRWRMRPTPEARHVSRRRAAA